MDKTPWNAAAYPSAAFFALVRHPLKYRLFLLRRLPAAYFSGLRIEAVDAEHCVVSVPFKWFTQNPFRSTYFACLSMAAELSTGVLVMANVFRRRPGVSTLVIGLEARFFKKATGRTLFTCPDGLLIKEAIEKAVATSAPQTITARSTGRNSHGEVVAEFTLVWSFKAKS